jgi:hypothetical protein
MIFYNPAAAQIFLAPSRLAVARHLPVTMKRALRLFETIELVRGLQKTAIALGSRRQGLARIALKIV